MSLETRVYEAAIPFAAVVLRFIRTKAVRPSPSFSGSNNATRPSRMPSSSSFLRRFQHGVVARLTASASACKERVQSLCSNESSFTVNFI